jgi:uncharacterized membrane protein YhaH (DUF805 family)
MTFSEAVESGFNNYVNFQGRSSRSAFWWWFLFGVLVGIGANIIDAILGSYPIISLIVGLGLFLPGLAVAVRRLHDTDRTGWWVLIELIPLIGIIVLIVFWVQQSDPGENKYGSPPVDAPAAAAPPSAPPPSA